MSFAGDPLNPDGRKEGRQEPFREDRCPAARARGERVNPLGGLWLQRDGAGADEALKIQRQPSGQRDE